MTEETQIRVFALSKKDRAFKENTLECAIRYLKQLKRSGNKPYYFRALKPRNFPVGSIAVFKFKGIIFGKAITKGKIRPLADDDVYTASVMFDPLSIEVFTEEQPKQKIIEKKFDIRFGRTLFKKLTWEQYQRVLRMAKRKP